MADIAITAANVVSGAGAVTQPGIAGATITAGQWVYQDPTTNKWLLADNNSATVPARFPGGVALGGAANNQPITVQISGPITIGGTLTAGVAYYLSATPGAMCPVADLTTGMSPSVLGIATSTTVLLINITQSGVLL